MGLERMGLGAMPGDPDPARALGEAAAPAELLLTSHRSIAFFNSEFRALPSLRQREPDPIALLHPEAARRHGIEDGQWMAVRCGGDEEVRYRARLTEDVRSDTVSVVPLWWYPERMGTSEAWAASNVNVVLHGALADRYLGAALQRGVPCRIRSAERPWADETNGGAHAQAETT
jgi:anaerobic selenocysteine-containing dehydrogenase